MKPLIIASIALFSIIISPSQLACFGAEPTQGGVASVTSVELSVSPLMPRSAAGERNIVLVMLESAGLSNTTLRLTAPEWPQAQVQGPIRIGRGKQRISLEIPPITKPLTVALSMEDASGKREFPSVTVQPPRRWTIYLAQHTHTDIGYTRPQTEILPENLRYIDYALDYCDLTDAYPDDARFRWTCETSWAVREYFKCRPAKQIQRLKKRIAEGRIEVCGLMLNMSEIAPESALLALLRPVRGLQQEFGIPIRTAMQNDVNGAGWCLPDYMSDIGIRYLTMGVNKTRSILPFDKPTPFWWESPSGKRVLACRADHYHLGNFWGIHEGKLEKFKPGLEQYLLSLQKRGYAFDRAGVQFSGYHTDNSPPAAIGCDLVKAWNEQFAWPHLRLALAQEYLAWVEKEQGDKLPVHRQAWPDWWTDGFGSAARETAAARETESAMQVNHGLLAMSSILGATIQPATMQRAAAIQDDLLFYHEHTYGAAESISDPLAENSQVQWGEKGAYAWTAVKNAAMLREEAFGLLQDYLPRAEVPTLAVCNTLNWPRSGLVRVFIDHEILPRNREARILDGSQPVLAQAMESRAEGTWWAIWVRDVPPLGYKVLRLETNVKSDPKPSLWGDTNSLENSFYKLAFDQERGALASLVDKETNAELVDQKSAWGLGQCIYETMPANREMKPEVFKRTSLRNVQVKPGAQGPIWKSLLVSADLDGCASNRGVRVEIRLYEPEKRIELHYALRKLPVPTPESVYVALPFQGENWKMLYEAQGGCVEPGKDQIPGSSSDWQTIQSFISLANSKGQVVMGSDQVPLVQLGDFNLGKWMPVTQVNKPHVYSWVMNNYWFTNFRTEQEGEFKWHYYLTSSKDTSRSFATRFGWGSRIPLATRVLPPTKKKPGTEPQSLSTVSIKASNLLILEARPMSDGRGIFMHYRELDGKPVTLTESEVDTHSQIQQADELNALEQPLKEGVDSVTFKPYEVKFIRASFQ